MLKKNVAEKRRVNQQKKCLSNAGCGKKPRRKSPRGVTLPPKKERKDNVCGLGTKKKKKLRGKGKHAPRIKSEVKTKSKVPV